MYMSARQTLHRHALGAQNLELQARRTSTARRDVAAEHQATGLLRFG